MNTSSAELAKAEKVLLQVEVLSGFRKDFEAKYKQITGKIPSGESYIVVEKAARGDRENFKNGARIQIYFNGSEMIAKNLKMFGYDITHFYGGEWQFGGNNQELFWKLLYDGFRLGTKTFISLQCCA